MGSDVKSDRGVYPIFVYNSRPCNYVRCFWTKGGVDIIVTNDARLQGWVFCGDWAACGGASPTTLSAPYYYPLLHYPSTTPLLPRAISTTPQNAFCM